VQVRNFSPQTFVNAQLEEKKKNTSFCNYYCSQATSGRGNIKRTLFVLKLTAATKKHVYNTSSRRFLVVVVLDFVLRSFARGITMVVV
jgi:hypothetical protein